MVRDVLVQTRSGSGAAFAPPPGLEVPYIYITLLRITLGQESGTFLRLLAARPLARAGNDLV